MAIELLPQLISMTMDCGTGGGGDKLTSATVSHDKTLATTIGNNRVGGARGGGCR